MRFGLKLGGRNNPTIPADIAEAVEMWARGRGRHARMEWNPHLGCAVIHFRIPGNSRSLADYQAGLAPEPTESIALHEWDAEKGHYVPLDLGQYGVGGIVELLERADTRSGRGEFGSLQEQVDAVMRRNEVTRRQQAATAEEAGREAAWLHRRSILGTPQVRGADFTREG
jgi:hypothetical protein